MVKSVAVLLVLVAGQAWAKGLPPRSCYVVVRGLRVTVFGDTLPEKVMAIGGDGESEIGQAVGRNADLDGEGKKLLLEAAKVAVAQAVDMTVAKLNLADQPVRLTKKKKR